MAEVFNQVLFRCVRELVSVYAHILTLKLIADGIADTCANPRAKQQSEELLLLD